MLIEKEATTTLRASSALTGSLVASDTIDTQNASYVELFIAYAKASGTQCEIYVEGIPEGGSTWHTIAAQSAGTVSGGVVAVTLARPVYTLTESEACALAVPVFGWRKLRVRAKETGTADGTLSVVAVAVRVGA